jgi:tetratricopeptide (TPR) repeat protein
VAWGKILAVSSYEAVLAKDNSVKAALNNLASLLTDHFPSEENLKKALTLSEPFNNATEPYYLDTYAWVNVQLGNLDKAQKILERVVSLSPDVAVFNYHLGALYQKQGAQLDAEKYLTIAKDLAAQQQDSVTAAKVSELLATR